MRPVVWDARATKKVLRNMPEATDQMKEQRLAAYLGERKRLTRLAYRYLGSVSEAEDAVQDAWLRFADAEAPEDAGRYLSRIVTNLCLDRLKSASRRRDGSRSGSGPHRNGRNCRGSDTTSRRTSR